MPALGAPVHDHVATTQQEHAMHCDRAVRVQRYSCGYWSGCPPIRRGTVHIKSFDHVVRTLANS